MVGIGLTTPSGALLQAGLYCKAPGIAPGAPPLGGEFPGTRAPEEIDPPPGRVACKVIRRSASMTIPRMTTTRTTTRVVIRCAWTMLAVKRSRARVRACSMAVGIWDMAFAPASTALAATTARSATSARCSWLRRMAVSPSTKSRWMSCCVRRTASRVSDRSPTKSSRRSTSSRSFSCSEVSTAPPSLRPRAKRASFPGRGDYGGRYYQPIPAAVGHQGRVKTAPQAPRLA